MTFSRHAFQCHKCPKQAGDKGCPAWWETVWEKPRADAVADVTTVKGCAFEQMPNYLIEVVKASNRPAAELGQIREELLKSLGRLSLAIAQFASRLNGIETRLDALEQPERIALTHDADVAPKY